MGTGWSADTPPPPPPPPPTPPGVSEEGSLEESSLKEAPAPLEDGSEAAAETRDTVGVVADKADPTQTSNNKKKRYFGCLAILLVLCMVAVFSVTCAVGSWCPISKLERRSGEASAASTLDNSNGVTTANNNNNNNNTAIDQNVTDNDVATGGGGANNNNDDDDTAIDRNRTDAVTSGINNNSTTTNNASSTAPPTMAPSIRGRHPGTLDDVNMENNNTDKTTTASPFTESTESPRRTPGPLSPSRTPTRSPTTRASSGGTTSIPTKTPTSSATSLPTTQSPTSNNSINATTGSPTGVPTSVPTTIPTTSPTKTPTTNSPTSSPTLPPFNIDVTSDLYVTLASVSRTPDLLADPRTPPGGAAFWMSSINARSLDPRDNSTTAQRYAVVLLDLAWNVNVADPKTHECNWKGVQCVNDTSVVRAGRMVVQTIEWSNLGLKGSIPEDVGLLSGLERLDVAENVLTGKLPDGLYALTKLRYLYLHQNRLQGTISTEIGALTKLLRLYMGDNRLTGPLPQEIASPGLEPSNARVMEWLSLYNNQLTGTLPENSNWHFLFTLDLGRNQLTGTVPADWVQGDNTMLRLRNLYIDHNRLSGTLPADWETLGLGRMNTIVISDNKFTGSVPGFYESRRTLHNLEVQNNNFSYLQKGLCNHPVFVAGELTTMFMDCDICTCNFLCPDTCYD